MYGGLCNLAVIEWCKLCGAEGTNAVHRKRIYQDRQDEFRVGLFDALSTDAAGCGRYWREMKHWRDTDFAHFDPDAQRQPKWPHFEAATLAADYYYGWIVAELNEVNHFMHPPDLAHYRRVVRREFDSAAAIALASTKHLPASRI